MCLLQNGPSLIIHSDSNRPATSWNISDTLLSVVRYCMLHDLWLPEVSFLQIPFQLVNRKRSLGAGARSGECDSWETSVIFCSGEYSRLSCGDRGTNCARGSRPPHFCHNITYRHSSVPTNCIRNEIGWFVVVWCHWTTRLCIVHGNSTMFASKLFKCSETAKDFMSDLISDLISLHFLCCHVSRWILFIDGI